MSSRLRLAFILFLCCLATGVQWDLLQAFAWGRMIVGHAQTESLAAAVSETFSGETCSICRSVAAARQQEQSRSPVAPLKLESKILLFFQPAPRLEIAVRPGRLVRAADPQVRSRGRAMPPVPPPRTAAA